MPEFSHQLNGGPAEKVWVHLQQTSVHVTYRSVQQCGSLICFRTTTEDHDIEEYAVPGLTHTGMLE